MHASFSAVEAFARCQGDCLAGDCKAFSLQYDYDKKDGSKYCFLYKDSAEPRMPKCASDPFNTLDCSYVTNYGEFWITPAAKAHYNVLDKVR